jgi:hypothetical protein
LKSWWKKIKRVDINIHQEIFQSMRLNPIHITVFIPEASDLTDSLYYSLSVSNGMELMSEMSSTDYNDLITINTKQSRMGNIPPMQQCDPQNLSQPS